MTGMYGEIKRTAEILRPTVALGINSTLSSNAAVAGGVLTVTYVSRATEKFLTGDIAGGLQDIAIMGAAGAAAYYTYRRTERVYEQTQRALDTLNPG
ncbi:MAG: hypothetical protein SFW62_02280 [Alphaproteobacteria bacterium]|nr:hypothetical protein [Alphaproteobacteria bacterium]